MSMKETLFLHIDLDAFFASVEQLDHPEYRGKPVIVGGHGKRGVVSTCSYEARAFGVHSAMPSGEAHRLCPHGIFVNGRMDRYHQMSIEVMSILKTYTPNFHQMSIDEAFLDISGMEKLKGSAETIACMIKKEVKEKTGLNISIGVASTKYIAKIASNKSKPNGLLIVPAGSEKNFIQNLELKEIWGVGKKTREQLAKAGFMSIEQLLNIDLNLMQKLIGNSAGAFLYDILNGKTEKVFNEPRLSHSISTERTFSEDIDNKYFIDNILFEMANEIFYRLISEKVKSKTVAVKIRYSDFKTVTIQEVGDIINDANDLYHRARKLFYKKNPHCNPVRLFGISALNIHDEINSGQVELFTDEKLKKKRIAEEAVFKISKKMGKPVIKRARLMKDKK